MVSFVPLQTRLHRCFLLTILAAACNPYSDREGEFNAGPVDAANFPLAYKGAGGDDTPNGYLAGKGTFTEIGAFIGNRPAGYYFFPFTTAQFAEQDPLVVYLDPTLKKPYTPKAYVFDPAPPRASPSSPTCIPPRNYSYNEERDDMRLDEQSNIFTQLPIATERPGQPSSFDYIPVVAEVAVSATGLKCQSLKSEATLNQVLGKPPATGNSLLWAIIDPSAGVYRVGQTGDLTRRTLPDGGANPAYSRGQDTQKWGWFGKYYLAYIDGGYVPTRLVTVTVGSGPRAKQIQTPQMMTQRLYVPSTISSPGVRCGSTTCSPGQVCQQSVCQTCTDNFAVAPATCPAGRICCPTDYRTCTQPSETPTPPKVCTTSGVRGASPTSYDVLQLRRGEDGYSPVCAVWTYDANTSSPPNRPLAISELPTSAADINALPNRATTGANRLIYCPQVD